MTKETREPQINQDLEPLKALGSTIYNFSSAASLPVRSAMQGLGQAIYESKPLIDEFINALSAEVCNRLASELQQLEQLPETGQHHLEMDENALKSTGKSVSVDEVIANIDKALGENE